MNSSREVTPRESDVDFASDTEAADFSPEELIWGVTWLSEWVWLAELEVDWLVERDVDSDKSWLTFDETSVLLGSWGLAEADSYTTSDTFTSFEAKAETDDQFDVSDIEWLDEADLSVEGWLDTLIWNDADANVEIDPDVEADSKAEACLREVDSEVLVETDSEFKIDSETLAETDVEFKTDSDAVASDALVEAVTETLVDSEINSDTEADWSSEDSIWATDAEVLV